MRLFTRLITGAGVVAVAALSLGFTSAAWAKTTEILPTPSSGKPDSYIMTGGASKLVSKSGVEVKCKASEGTGKETSADEGEEENTIFTGCTGPLGVTCTGLVDPSGQILTFYVLHLGWSLRSGSWVLIWMVLELPYHYECGGVLFITLGCAIGTAAPANTSTKEDTATFKQSKGVNELTTGSLNELGSSFSCVLETSASGGKYEQTGLEATETASDFKHNGESISEELMD
jgi:hypothetical protein